MTMKMKKFSWTVMLTLVLGCTVALGGAEATIRLEILKQYDPDVVNAKRPSWSGIREADILDLREHPKRDADLAKLMFDPTKLSDEQKEIITKWVRGGHNKLFLTGANIARYAGILGIEHSEIRVSGGSGSIPLLLSKGSPVGIGIGDLTVPADLKITEGEAPVFIWYSPKESSLQDPIIVARYDTAEKPAAMGSFRVGKTKVFFEGLRGQDGLDSYRLRLNWNTWRIGLRVPGARETIPIGPDEVLPYPPYPGAVPSGVYSVKVNGQPVFVHDFPTYGSAADKTGAPGDMAYAHFAMRGKVTVSVTLKTGKVNSCTVSPLAYGITPRMNGNTVTFELDRPRYLIAFINEPASFNSSGLMLFAEAPEKNPPTLGDSNVTNILDYGVDSTGKTVETAKINKAITDVATKPGGGVLYFPKYGVYRTGTIMMKSNVTLYVEAGALIQGSSDRADYPVVSNGSGWGNACLIFFKDCENASLMGRGTIDGAGYPELRATVRGGGRGIYGYKLGKSRNILFQDLILRRAAKWTVHLFDCDYFTSRNVKIINRKTKQNEDIYDFDVSRHILIENGFGLTMDDFFTMKGTPGATGQPIEDIVVKGFVGYGYDSGLAIGYTNSESNYKYIKDVVLEDVHNISNLIDHGVFLSFTPGSATQYQDTIVKPLENFRFVNWTFEEGGFIYISAGDASFKNFSFENCTVYGEMSPGKISGKNFEGLSFKNLRINGELIDSAEKLKKAGIDIMVPATFAP